jgi:glutamyl-tRNA synthetase
VSDTDVRVRFAPSPTGQLHVGSARTALYNWAFARHHGGTFILRVDDTDAERSTAENTQAILDAMRWLGLDWDEGPDVGGPNGPYYQTERAHLYAQALTDLREAGRVYPCFCTVEQLEAKRAAARDAGTYAVYDRACRGLDAETAGERIAAGEPHVWRVAVPIDRGDVVFEDAVRGRVATPATSLDDMVIVRSDGTPTYNFATVVDDAFMAITHVIRGEDHISNTARQIIVFEALGYEVPVFAHMSLTFGTDGKKLSKRHGAATVEAFRDMGFLPDALVNFIALLGWSLDDKTTVMSRQEIVDGFTLDRLSPNPGIFDIEKLEWMNGVYVREMTPEALAAQIVDVLADAGVVEREEAGQRQSWFEMLAAVLQERLKRLDEVPQMTAFLFADEVEIDEKARAKVLEKEGAGRALDAVAQTLAELDPFESDPIEEVLREIPAELQLKPRIVFQAVRVAISGSTVSPPLFESLELLGRSKALERIADARRIAAE